MGEEHLTSPPINCSGHDGIHLRFMRWLGVEAPTVDHAYVRVSTDNVNWTTIWQNGCTLADNLWMPVEIDLSPWADGHPTIYLRWTMGPTNGSFAYCGWNIDDVKLISYSCQSYLCGDANGDEITDISDAVVIINYIFVGGNPPDPMLSGDANCDEIVDVSDAVWIVNYVFIGGNQPCDTDGNGVPDC